MQSNWILIASAYAAFNRRDIDAVLALMDPDVDWPKGMDGDRARGHQEVREYWTLQWSQVDPHVEPVSMIDDESGNTVVSVHQVVRDLSGNTLLDQPIQHIYQIRNHRIMRMDIQRPVPDQASTTQSENADSVPHLSRT